MICVNELSFVGQAKDAYEATVMMHNFARLIGEAQIIFNDRRTAAHSTFYDRSIAPDFTILNWLYANGTDRTAKQLFLALTKKGPFVDDLIRSECNCCCSASGRNIANSGLAGVAHFDGVAISLKNADDMSVTPVAVDFCGEPATAKRVSNISEESDFAPFRRTFRPTAKHCAGGLGTLMDLDDATAQTVLDTGIVFGRRIYAFYNEKAYVFLSDNAGGFHGYPIEEEEVPDAVRR